MAKRPRRRNATYADDPRPHQIGSGRQFNILGGATTQSSGYCRPAPDGWRKQPAVKARAEHRRKTAESAANVKSPDQKNSRSSGNRRAIQNWDSYVEFSASDAPEPFSASSTGGIVFFALVVLHLRFGRGDHGIKVMGPGAFLDFFALLFFALARILRRRHGSHRLGPQG